MSKNNTKTPDLFGIHAVREAWLNETRTVHKLFITPQAARQFDPVLKQAQKKGLPRPSPTVTDKQKLDKICPRGAVHQGIALSCAPLPERDEQDFIIRAHAQERCVYVMLDQVTDPHNVGAILRSASAFGLDGVLMQTKHAPALNGVLAKTACGAVEHIEVAHATNLARAIKDFQNAGFFVIGLDERGRHVIGDSDPALTHDKVVLVLGSEGDGLRRLVKESCDTLAKLPTGGAIASLNVSNAAAVTFFAYKKDAPQ